MEYANEEAGNVDVEEYGICERRSRECGCGRVWNVRAKAEREWKKPA